MEKVTAVLRFIGRSAWRVGVLVVGAALLVAGLVMMVTPGPGLVLIIAGLVVLATEFAWAEAMLTRARDAAAKGKDAITRRRRGPADEGPPGDGQDTLGSGRSGSSP